MRSEAIVREQQVDKVAALQQVPLFAGLDPVQLEQVAAKSRVCAYPEGAEIIEQGAEILDYDDGLYLLIDGEVEVRRGATDAGAGRLLARFGPGEFFGELALLDEENRSASVFAAAETLCLVLNRWDFQRYLHYEPGLAVKMLGTLATRLRRTSGHVV